MNPLRVAILTIIVAMFSANVLVWHFKNKARAEPVAEGRWEDSRQESVRPQPVAPVQPAPRPAPQVVVPTPVPVPVQSQVSQPRTYKEALQLAQQTNRQVFLFFTSTSCGYCTAMKRETLSQPQIQQLLSQYVVYQIRTDGPEGYIAQEAGISSVPYYVICTADRQIVKVGKGYRSPASFQAWLSQ